MNNIPHAVVTTPRRPKPADVDEARAQAKRLGLSFVERRSLSWERLVEESGAQAVLAAAVGDRALWLPGMRQPWRFHGGMAVLRIRRLLEHGEMDPFLVACDCAPAIGSSTAPGGACADALSRRMRSGRDGHVEVVEASPLLHAVIAHGVEQVRFGEAPIDSAWIACTSRWATTSRCCARCPTAPTIPSTSTRCSARARAQPPGFDVVRALADPRPLAAEALVEARRVARRRVVIQDRKRGGELERLGIPELPVMGRYAAARFGGGSAAREREKSGRAR